ncbi:hypothetical protein Vretifemale_18123, partial [Volvox reticuliferus]
AKQCTEKSELLALAQGNLNRWEVHRALACSRLAAAAASNNTTTTKVTANPQQTAAAYRQHQQALGDLALFRRQQQQRHLGAQHDEDDVPGSSSSHHRHPAAAAAAAAWAGAMMTGTSPPLAKVHKELLLRLHPDKNGGGDLAKEAFQYLQEAYKRLSMAERRGVSG